MTVELSQEQLEAAVTEIVNKMSAVLPRENQEEVKVARTNLPGELKAIAGALHHKFYQPNDYGPSEELAVNECLVIAQQYLMHVYYGEAAQLGLAAIAARYTHPRYHDEMTAYYAKQKEEFFSSDTLQIPSRFERGWGEPDLFEEIKTLCAETLASCRAARSAAPPAELSAEDIAVAREREAQAAAQVMQQKIDEATRKLKEAESSARLAYANALTSYRKGKHEFLTNLGREIGNLQEKGKDNFGNLTGEIIRCTRQLYNAMIQQPLNLQEMQQASRALASLGEEIKAVVASLPSLNQRFQSLEALSSFYFEILKEPFQALAKMKEEARPSEEAVNQYIHEVRTFPGSGVRQQIDKGEEDFTDETGKQSMLEALRGAIAEIAWKKADFEASIAEIQQTLQGYLTAAKGKERELYRRILGNKPGYDDVIAVIREYGTLQTQLSELPEALDRKMVEIQNFVAQNRAQSSVSHSPASSSSARPREKNRRVQFAEAAGPSGAGYFSGSEPAGSAAPPSKRTPSPTDS